MYTACMHAFCSWVTLICLSIFLHEQDVKESVLDTQLIYALARINKMSELEELISGPNVAKIDQIGKYLSRIPHF